MSVHPPSILTAPPAPIDRLRNGDLPLLHQLAAIAGFALLTAAGAKINLPLWAEVPFTLQTVFVYGSGLFLGAGRGALAQVLYLAAGLFWPVTAGEGSGLAYLTGRASSGYLLAFPLVAAVCGFASERWNSLWGSMLSAQMGSLVLFLCGFNWLYFALESLSWMDALYNGWVKFLPFDLAKIALTAFLYQQARKLSGRARNSQAL